MNSPTYWLGQAQAVAYTEQAMQANLSVLQEPCYVIRNPQGQIGIAVGGSSAPKPDGQYFQVLAQVNALVPQQLGDPSFKSFYNLQYAYKSGAMANGIASEDLVIALAKKGFLGSFGAAGLVPVRIEAAIAKIKNALSNETFAFNLIHSPAEEALERNAVDLFLKHQIRVVEASAFLDLTPHIVYYRASGLSLTPQNQIVIANKVIAKISRREVAQKFMQPAPERILNELVAQGKITELQAKIASQIPMADDITVEADSGGHTDNRPLVCLLPSILSLRDEIQQKYRYPQQIRVGAAGGISTPESTLAAYMMGASYVVTGSINQACLEAGTSPHVRKVLAGVDMADVMMAPAADMFEMGVKLQVLKRGTLFPMRAQKLYEIYREYESIEAIPTAERQKLEQQVFRANLDEIWAKTVAFFQERDPEQITRANENPKRKMALIFRWYLGLSSRWANTGEAGREMDYQIWCGPAMGAFNDWTRGTYLEKPENRYAADVAEQLLYGTAYIYRIRQLAMQGLQLPSSLSVYKPKKG